MNAPSEYVRNIRKRDRQARQNLPPAGIIYGRDKSRFRCGLIIGMEPLLTHLPARMWNHPDSRQHSCLPVPLIGLPFDNSKPRRGRWGEIPGTRISDDSAPIEYLWNEKMSRMEREQKAIEEAKADLQRRIEICLYGKTRDPPLPPSCVLGSDGIYRKSERLMSWLQHSSPRSSVQRTERELEQHLNWPPCVPLFTGQAPQPLKYHYQPTDARSDHKQSCPNTATTKQQDYKFRYDDGLSARLGVKRIPLLMGQHGRDGQFVFQPSPYGVDKPLRTQPKQLQPYWTPVKSPETPKPKIHTRRHIGVFCDPNLLPPNETILKNF